MATYKIDRINAVAKVVVLDRNDKGLGRRMEDIYMEGFGGDGGYGWIWMEEAAGWKGAWMEMKAI